ncbi:unnamed protein product [Allacma fusca]|uniref:HRDC domain-containing protein n=1 Tax=Allacma fusca TaxID=39272 RepID=A0A8J2KE41_9HEXA|nr:unnamed protein product [Allacma fusca]
MTLVAKFVQKSTFPGIRKFSSITIPTEGITRNVTPDLNSVSVTVRNKNEPNLELLETFRQQEASKLLQTKCSIPWTTPEVSRNIGSTTIATDKKRSIWDWRPAPLFLKHSFVKWPVLNVQDTPMDIINTEEKFKEMMTELRDLQVMEIGFRVKNSSTNYQRLACLITISTRFKDYVVDCLSLEKEIVKELNEIFANPYILKVTFCGKVVDILSLKKDFGIHVIGLFDIRKAERIIKSTEKIIEERDEEINTFGYFLHKYINIESSHRGFWKQRPLTETTIKAARKDSHFLLNVYDQQKELLMKLENGYLLSVYELSKSAQTQGLSARNENEWMEKYKNHFNEQQWHALTELNTWRKRIAQDRNCNVRLVATNKILTQLAERLPKTEEHFMEIISRMPCTTARIDLKNDSNLLVKLFQ